MTTPSRITLGLVDPLRAAKAFIPELERRKLDYLIIESGLMDGVRDGVKDPDRCVPAAASVELMAEKLRKLGVTHMIGCVEHSLVYTEQLCAQMGLPSNGLRLSKARRHKTLTGETLRKANIRVPKQLETDQLSTLLAWAEDHGCPIVLKPVNSGGTDNVHLCQESTDVAEAFRKIVGARSLTGEINTSVLAQEYVDGVEYIIDSVSANGHHASINFLEYQKGVRNGRAFVYEKVRFLRSEHPVCEKLRVFAHRVLDALEIRSGASHMEVKINCRDEVVFIEVGARLSGGDTYQLVQDARMDGKSQVQCVLDAIQGIPLPSPNYETAKEAVRVFIISEAEGRLKSLANLASIEALRSFARLRPNVEVGKPVSKTVDLGSVAGYVELVAADPAVLAEDEGRLDDLLRRGVMVLD